MWSWLVTVKWNLVYYRRNPWSLVIMNILWLGTGDSGGTESPIRRWTGLHYTEPGDDGVDLIGLSESSRSNGEIWRDQMGTGFGSSGMKSTRHLPQPKYHDNFHKNFYSHRSPTSATIQVWPDRKPRYPSKILKAFSLSLASSPASSCIPPQFLLFLTSFL